MIPTQELSFGNMDTALHAFLAQLLLKGCMTESQAQTPGSDHLLSQHEGLSSISPTSRYMSFGQTGSCSSHRLTCPIAICEIFPGHTDRLMIIQKARLQGL